MIVLMWALRSGAPTRLARCGAIASIVARAIGAAAYAFSCRGDSVAFIATWYTAGIMLCALIGAQLGPRLLRWSSTRVTELEPLDCTRRCACSLLPALDQPSLAGLAPY